LKVGNIPVQLTNFEVRRLTLAIIQRAFEDLTSDDPLERKKARDWLAFYGLELAEMTIDIPIEVMVTRFKELCND
jgi:hypothetical protein